MFDIETPKIECIESNKSLFIISIPSSSIISAAVTSLLPLISKCNTLLPSMMLLNY